MELPKKEFIIDDGPPFASGDPHFGHFICALIKDVIKRHYNASIKMGWDTHGVPIESKANDILKITNRNQILELGIDKYNEVCRNLVMTCIDKWASFTEKMNRDVDINNAYKTMDIEYMNSVWWVFSELYKKGYIYKGKKIMYFSPGLECTLSNNEASDNYKNTKDPSLTLKIPIIKDNEECYILVWTTTPWTLSFNMLLCVNGKGDYCLFEKDDKYYISLLSYAYESKHKIIKTFKGKELENIKYNPLFNFINNDNCFKIVIDDFVDIKGVSPITGVVHISPLFGEEDYNLCVKLGLEIPDCPLNDKCEWIGKVAENQVFGKRFVKDCDKDIIEYLKKNNYVYSFTSITHSYPFCYRTDTPLIQRVCEEWFINVKDNVDRIKKVVSNVNWYCEEAKNRFIAQLNEPRDWCISRNRFWGTPIPIWENEKGEIKVFESGYSLEKYISSKQEMHVTIDDIHLDKINNFEFEENNTTFKHCGIVLDCWFESGCMPYGKYGYPYCNSEKYNRPLELDEFFPCDFICEGIDQTRGWFYSLLVLSTLLFDRPSFKGVCVNGHILGNDGLKMSKKLGNFTSPEIVLDKYGSDVVRLMFLTCPAVKGQNYKINDKAFEDIQKSFTYMINNTLDFWKQSLEILKFKGGDIINIKFKEEDNDILNNWILEYVDKFKDNIKSCIENCLFMEIYDIINDMIDKLSRWYIKLKKSDLKGENSKEKHIDSFLVLSNVLYKIGKSISSITPNMSVKILSEVKDMFKEIEKEGGDNIESMNIFIDIINNSRKLDKRNNRPRKKPIKSIKISLKDYNQIEKLKMLEIYIKEEINVEEIIYDDKYYENVKFEYQYDKGNIKNDFKDYNMNNFIFEDIRDIERIKYKINDKSYQYILLGEDYFFKHPKDKEKTSDNVYIDYDNEYDEDKYIINCMIREINEERKKCKLKPINDVNYKMISNDKMKEIINKYQDYIIEKLGKKIEFFEFDYIKNNYNHRFMFDFKEYKGEIYFFYNFL